MIETQEARIRDIIAACVAAYVAHGGTYKEIADMSGISASAVKRLADHTTVYPRFHTVLAVLYAFNRELQVKETVPTGGDKKKAMKYGRPEGLRLS